MVLGCGMLLGQTAAAAELQGTIYDPSGAVVPDASVTLRDQARGFRRTVFTDNRGLYRLLSLPPGRYQLRIEKEGFRAADIDEVTLTIGQAGVQDSQLSLGERLETVAVDASAQMIESARGQQANTLPQLYVENLPINRRDYLNFVLLVPGVTDANALVDSTDF